MVRKAVGIKGRRHSVYYVFYLAGRQVGSLWVFRFLFNIMLHRMPG